MMFIRSLKYPALRVHLDGDTSVKFHEGVAEVDDATAELLLDLEGFYLEPIEPDEDPEDEDEDEDDRSEWDEAQLRAFADEHGIDLGKVQNVDKIRARIDEALSAK